MSDETIFAAALELPAADRTAYLATACGSDAARRQRVEGLLTASDRAGAFMARPAVEEGTELVDPSSTPNDVTVTRAGPDQPAADDAKVPLGFLQPATRPDSLGRIGHYEVLQVLGQGGFGIVFRAFDDVLQRVVAVKVLAPQLAATSPARKRFLREARSSAQVRHENVVQVYEVGETPLPYIAMEFIPGETLQQRLNRIGPVEPAEVVRVGRQVAEGLAAAHATDLIHRDIKPGNVLLESGPQQRAKITDFGLARAADDASISQSGIIAGTPMYMAPEQALGHKLDQRADLFSLGSVLYQMAAGRAPFRANGTVAVLKRVAEDTPRDIREVIPETPSWLCSIIAKLHAKNPNDRYQSAREVAEVLADCEAQLKANAKLKDFSRIPRSEPPQRSFVPYKGVAAVVLLAAIGILVAAWNWPDSRPHATQSGLPTVTTPTTPPTLAAVGSGPTELIQFARPEFSHGRWMVRDGKLVHPSRSDAPHEAAGWPAVPLAARGPDEFDLKVEFERTTGREFISFGMAAFGRRFKVALDTAGRFAELQAVDGIYHDAANPTRRVGPWLTNGRRHVLRCEVRSSGIRAWLDGREAVDYRGRYESLTCDPPGLDWAPFFIMGRFDCEFVVHKFVLTPRTSAAAPPARVTKQEPLPPTYKNDIGMEFVVVPKGKSWLGGGKDKPGDRQVEIPADFYLGKYEVTQEEWEKVMGENPSWFSRTGDGNQAVKDVSDADLKRFPVENVSWDDCQLFLAKLNQREKETGWVYRLPKNSEWEYACRSPMADKADSAFDFYFARPTTSLSPEQANFNGGLNRSCKVGSYQPNRLGLFDMHGNVAEWCHEPWTPLTRILHGGCWSDEPAKCTAVFGGVMPASGKNYAYGLRLARIPSGAPSPEAKTPPAVAPFTDADVARIAALPAAEQVEEVRKELMRRNPGFDGTVGHKSEDGVVTEIRTVTDHVTDIAPIRVFNALRVLDCNGTLPRTWEPNGLLADLSPLEGMNLAGLTHLRVANSPVADTGMACFKDCKGLKHLDLTRTRVGDEGLAHFKYASGITYLDLGRTKVTDKGLAHFKECKNLTYLNLHGTQVSDAGLAVFKDL
jgi:serine/threonine protein kinase/formylglycine-generating enzyme required for sulfatase activity